MATVPQSTTTLKCGTLAAIRTAVIADAGQLVALAEALYEDQEGVVGEPGENEWSVAREQERIEDALSNEDRVAMVAVVGDAVIGRLDFQLGNRRRLRHQGEFALGVLPDWRGRGVGRWLLTNLIAWAQTRDVERIGLTVLGDAERAIGLYRSLGFQEEGRRVRQVKYGPGRYADQVQMRRSSAVNQAELCAAGRLHASRPRQGARPGHPSEHEAGAPVGEYSRTCHNADGMTSDRENLVEQIIREAMGRAAGDRPAFLDAACGDDDALRAEVASRIAWHDEDDDATADAVAMAGATTGAMASPTRDPVIGQRIAHYHVKRVIASGGMGTVYLATQDQPRRTVALKLMKPGIVSRDALRRFEFEAQVLARLRHPGIAQVYDAGTHDDGSGGVPYFAMEYVPNARPLTEYADNAGLETSERLDLFARVCDAVHHGHQKGIIHRDLKPSNILVDSDGQPKVIDFGVARATDSDMAVTTLQTDVGQLVGTVQYMSPEQVEADPHNIDTRSDVYALGVVLFELLTGDLPYDIRGKPIYEAARVVREQPPTRPMTSVGPFDRDVETIVLKTLEKDRTRRYQSADDLGQDILRLLAGEAITARPPSVAYQVRIFARKNKVLVASAVMLLVVLVAGTIGTTVGMIRATRGMNRALAAEQATQREADRAAAVRDFLKQMLASANPFLPSRSSRAAMGGDLTTFAGRAGRDVAAVDLLRQAAETLETSFDDTPLIKAELRHTLGETLLGLGQLDEARTQLDLAIALRSRELGPDHADTARSRAKLAELLVWQGSPDRSDRIYAQAHAALEEALGPAHPETMAVAGRRAGALLHRGRLQGAIDLQRHTVDEATAALGADDPATLEQLVHLGFLYWTKSEFDRAIECGRRAAEGLARVAGEDAQTTALAKELLAGALRSSGRFAEARRFGEEALAAMRRNVGDEHPDTLSCIRNLANICLLLEDYEAANPLYREVLAAQRRLLPPTHGDLLLTLNDFATALAFQRIELDKAETYAREARAGLARIYGDETQYALNAADTLAIVLRARDDTQGAIAVYREILEAAERRDVQISVPIAAHVGIGDCYTDVGKFEDAERHLEAAVTISGAADDPAQLQAWRISPAFLALYEAWGREKEAAAWRARVASD